jgi:hypothetical protein
MHGDSSGPHVDVPPPRLDQHRDEILEWLARGEQERRAVRGSVDGT